MDTWLAEIEAAITEASRARDVLKRRRSKQVTSADEIDGLKSVAYAWFNTHRPPVESHPSRPDLSGVDQSLRDVLNATGRRAARNTYAQALKSAKAALIELRAAAMTGGTNTHIASTPSAFDESAPDFSALASDDRMKDILARRWAEVKKCLAGAAPLAATVMMGGLLESLFLARVNIVSDKKPIFTAKGAPKEKNGKTLPLGEWTLKHYGEVAHELGWITKSAKDVSGVLREFRNYVHPHKEYADSVVLTDRDSRMFWELTKTLSAQVLGSAST